MERRVGILLDPQTYRGVTRRETGHEDIELYNQSAQKLGLSLLYFTLSNVKGGEVTGLIWQHDRYRTVRRSIPHVTHNRTLIGSAAAKARMRRLQARSHVFNGNNRYSKLDIARLLAKHTALRPYLPSTIAYSPTKLASAMTKHQALFLKPLSSSIGKGIIKLSRTAAGRWDVQWGREDRLQAAAGGAAAWIHKRVGSRPYLIQQAIPLARYDGRPFDLRVSVQRDDSGVWQVTGILGKLAAAGSHVTNIARGGTSLPGDTLLRTGVRWPIAAEAELRRVSLAIAAALGKQLPHLADIGLDMGVDSDGRVYFIEMNGRHQRFAFQQAGMRRAYERTYEMPLRYAQYLLEQTKRQ